MNKMYLHLKQSTLEALQGLVGDKECEMVRFFFIIKLETRNLTEPQVCWQLKKKRKQNFKLDSFMMYDSHQ